MFSSFLKGGAFILFLSVSLGAKIPQRNFLVPNNPKKIAISASSSCHAWYVGWYLGGLGHSDGIISAIGHAIDANMPWDYIYEVSINLGIPTNDLYAAFEWSTTNCGGRYPGGPF